VWSYLLERWSAEPVFKAFLRSTYMTSAASHFMPKNCAVPGHQTGLSAFVPDEFTVAVAHPFAVL